MTPDLDEPTGNSELPPNQPAVMGRYVPRWHQGAATIVVMAAAVLASVAYWLKEDVSYLFLNYRTFEGQVWRLFTSALVHINLVHLGLNLYWLHRFMPYYERALGTWGTFAMLAFWAAIPNVAEYALLDGGIGLSGVVYAACGFLWWVGRRDIRFKNAVSLQTLNLFVAWFFICILLTVTNVMPIGNIAHGVGALCGVGTGWIYTSSGENRLRRLSAVIAGSALILVLAWVGRPLVNLSSHRGAELAWQAYEAQKAGELERAVRLYRDALAIQPHDARSWYNLGFALSQLRRDDEAADAVRRGCELEPGSRECNEARAHLKVVRAVQLLEQNQDKEALRLLRTAVELNDHSANGWYNLGVVLERLGRRDEATDAFQHAARLEPGNELFRHAGERAP